MNKDYQSNNAKTNHVKHNCLPYQSQHKSIQKDHLLIGCNKMIVISLNEKTHELVTCVNKRYMNKVFVIPDDSHCLQKITRRDPTKKEKWRKVGYTCFPSSNTMSSA